jgi:5S rRNA maturation endonuclease (ribonuclease M5)
MNKSEVLSLFTRHCENVRHLSGAQYHALCPFHDDTHHSFSFNTETTQYYCHACGESSNAVQFAKHFGENHKPFYSDDYQRNGDKTVGIAKKSVETNGKQAVKLSESELNDKAIGYMSNVNYGDDLGFYQLNMVGKDNSGRMTFPYFSKNGKSVIGIKHHKSKSGGQPYWEGDGKCKWYGEWNIRTQTDTVFIVEGEPDANLMGLMGLDAISSSAGAKSIPKYTPECLQNTREVIILYDNDKAGRIGEEKLAEHLSKILNIPIYIGQWRDGLPDGYDVGDSKLGDEFEYAINNKRIYEPRNEVSGVSNSQEGKMKTMGIFQLIDADYTSPDIVVRNMVQQESLSIISGCSGIGKSWIALNMGLSIAGGTPLFGFFEVDKPRKVLMAQFELTNGQVKERVEILQNHYDKSWVTIGSNFDYVILDEDNPSFTDRWDALDNLLLSSKYKGGVVIVDNLYTSVDANVDTSNNHDLIPVVSKWSEMMTKYQVSIVIITHHLKGRKRTPIDHDDILGGATLTRFASNIFQIKNSLLSSNLRVAMITKVRGEESHLVEIPFKLKFIDGVFVKGEVINNEALHYMEAKDRWEIQLVREMKTYEDQRDSDIWNRSDIWKYLSTQEGWEQTPTNERKVSRFISRTMDWGLMVKEGHNQYRIIATEFGDE